MESFVMKAEAFPLPIREKFFVPNVSVQEREGYIALVPIKESFEPQKNELDERQALKARIKKLRGIVRSDIDEKAELAKARSEKYESSD